MTESPKYFVLKKHKNMELRQYPARIQAEVSVDETNYKSAVERGFSSLAGYIFGNNVARQNIEMTTPVQVSQSQKIAMTTPVTVTGSDQFIVAFIMPSEYTLDTLPIPKDSRIRITQTSPHQMAAVRFSGYFEQKNIEKNQALLVQWLMEEGLQTEGEFIVAGYNPPWVPGFAARNEVLIKISPDLSAAPTE